MWKKVLGALDDLDFYPWHNIIKELTDQSEIHTAAWQQLQTYNHSQNNLQRQQEQGVL